MKTLLLLLPICFTGQVLMSQPTFTKAEEYNDYIVAQQTAIGNLILQLTEHLDTDDAATINANYAALQAQAETSLSNIERLDEFNGNTAFKSASLLLFEFYKEIINNEYGLIIAIILKEDLTQEDYEKINQYLTSIVENEAYYDEVFGTAQQQFANENGIELIDNELQDEIDKSGDE